MEDGFKNWPIVRKLLIDNRLEHSALLAYSINVSEAIFISRARRAYRHIEHRVDDAVAIHNDAVGDIVANALAREEAKARGPQIDPEIEAELTNDPPSTVVTVDRVTDEPAKEE